MTAVWDNFIGPLQMSNRYNADLIAVWANYIGPIQIYNLYKITIW